LPAVLIFGPADNQVEKNASLDFSYLDLQANGPSYLADCNIFRSNIAEEQVGIC